MAVKIAAASAEFSERGCASNERGLSVVDSLDQNVRVDAIRHQ